MDPAVATKRDVPGRLDDLVTIAARLFRERGYDATSMQGIADEMGILKGSLYHYVSNKEELLWLIVERPLRELVEGARASLGEPSKPLTVRIREAIHLHCESFERHYPHMFVMTREWGETLSTGRRQEIASLREAYFDVWREALEDGKRSGELRSDIDPTVASEAVLGMVNWMFRWFKPRGRLRASEIADQFTTIFEEGIISR